ncbi:hypothetical protein [Egibacter rhizosphaerae]|nr:hypothetical protein [Egibacter rhizosphaerae]
MAAAAAILVVIVLLAVGLTTGNGDVAGTGGLHERVQFSESSD